MDSYSESGENINIKTRKPYTITKQRERWTEEEHNRFLEALKLYGRAWQRIEEHIGTKTAVQIRSHAQKFFTKLEKEAVAKGVPIRQALDIEIPPPRPKRKPSYPYPRKTRTQVAARDGKPASLLSSLQSLDLERKPLPEKTNHQEKLENAKTNEEGQNGNIEGPQEACESLSSDPDDFKHEETNASYITIETRKHQELDQDGIKHTNITSNISLYESPHLAHENIIRGHVPVQVVDGNQGVTAKTSLPLDVSRHESTANNSGEVLDHPNPNLSVNNATFHPLMIPFSDNHENYGSFIHLSSTISSLIVSSLLQNPAAHAAATFAAKFYHPANTDSFSRDQLDHGTHPSTAAIAAATVAAATAWWSSHGLLPVCPPVYPGGYSCTFETPIDGNQVTVADNGRDVGRSEGNLQEEKMNAEEAKSAADLSSSEDSDRKLDTEVSPIDTKETAPMVDSSKSNLGKQVDRSSCGSNTIYSSKIETNALRKHAKEMQETKGSSVNESLYRRGRNMSEEGRLAFQALFSREVLPQSFLNTHTVAENDQPNIDKNSELDLNRSQEPGESSGFAVLRSVKLNVHHTGFKPYKKCSIEAKESGKIMSKASTSGQNDEKGPKRMCYETKAST